jgi:hypothetical protein
MVLLLQTTRAGSPTFPGVPNGGEHPAMCCREKVSQQDVICTTGVQDGEGERDPRLARPTWLASTRRRLLGPAGSSPGHGQTLGLDDLSGFPRSGYLPGRSGNVRRCHTTSPHTTTAATDSATGRRSKLVRPASHAHPQDSWDAGTRGAALHRRHPVPDWCDLKG